MENNKRELKYIIGRAGTGKTSCCIEEINREVEQDPLGPGIIYLVPEQMTHQMEMFLTEVTGGTMRVQVLSFRRLYLKILADLGRKQRVRLGELGKRMILRNILLEQKGELKTFGRSVERAGMADLLAMTLDEFKAYCIKPEDLQIEEQDQALKNKLDDLFLIYKEFQAKVSSEGIDPADELTVLAENLSHCLELTNFSVWVDGFKGFTPQEISVLSQLMNQCRKVTITLPLEPGMVKRAASCEEFHFKPGEELFSEPWQTYLSLSRLALEQGISIATPEFLVKPWRFNTPELRHLEQFAFVYPLHPFVSERPGPLALHPQLEVKFARNRRAEVEGMARELRTMAREKGLRWNQIAVLTRDLSLYDDLLVKTFSAYQIPFFMDYKRPIIHHPFIELILSAIELADSQWSYEPLFRCLKTDFFPLERDKIDRLENFCLAYGIENYRWEEDGEWNHLIGDSAAMGNENEDTILQADINQTRLVITGILKPFLQNMKKAGNVQELCASLYQLFTLLKVPERLLEWAEKAKASAQLTEARLHEQIWQNIVALLDEIVTSLGQDQLTLDDYALILSSGLENLEIGLTPPGIDQVLVGSLNRSRNPEVQVLFLIGASEGVMPAAPDHYGVFAPEERRCLESSGLKLSPQDERQVFDEEYYIYTGLTRATQKLFITYPLADEEGKGISASFLVKRLKGLFPGLTETGWGEQGLDLISAPYPLPEFYASRRDQGLSGAEHTLWEAAREWMESHQEEAPGFQILKQPFGNGEAEKKLSRSLARNLYGKSLKASVSRLELFNRCPFAHYARYGLKLKERRLYSFTSPDIGEFFHASLHDFALMLRERGLDWGSLSEDEIKSLVEEVGNQVAPRLQSAILLSKPRYRFITHKLKKTLRRAASILKEHARRGVFTPIALEADFGKGDFPGPQMALEDGDSLMLQGRIDRIDAGRIDGRLYLRIIDYKSRETDLSLDNIYYGLNLQLLTYLDVALQGAEILIGAGQTESGTEEALSPAGFLYFPVVEPLLKKDRPLTEDELNKERIGAVKIHGYLLSDPHVLEAMDCELKNGSSDLLNIKLKKDGNFTAHSKVLNPRQFELLRRHLHHLFRTSGNAMMDGDISVSPYQKGQGTACTYCEYKTFCQFDPELKKDGYRLLSEIKGEEVWKKIAEEDEAPDEGSLSLEQTYTTPWLGEEDSRNEFDGK